MINSVKPTLKIEVWSQNQTKGNKKNNLWSTLKHQQEIIRFIS